MTRRTLILVLALAATVCFTRVIAQEGRAPRRGPAQAPPPSARTDWQGTGNQGAVAAGGLGAVAGGARNPQGRRKRRRLGRRDDLRPERHRLAIVLLRRRSSHPLLRRQAPDRHRHRRPRRSPSSGDPRAFQGHRRHPRKGNRARRRPRRTRRLPHPARPLRHHDVHPGHRSNQKSSCSTARAPSPGMPTCSARSTLLEAAEAQAQPRRRCANAPPGRPLARHPPGRRRLLSRADRPSHRRLGARKRLLDPLRRSRHPRHPHRRTRLDQLPRVDRL